MNSPDTPAPNDAEKAEQRLVATTVKIAGLPGFTGRTTALGGGELNDTYVLHCIRRDVVLRISRHPGRNALKREERALTLLKDVPEVPKVIFFDENNPINDRVWIIEEYQPGQRVKRLSNAQFYSLGALLAKVHSVQNNSNCADPWNTYVQNCHRFGDEPSLLAHPDRTLQQQIRLFKETSTTTSVTGRAQALRHCDITPSNTLVDGSRVALIDWELSGFGDPMTDFATGYWSDMELNGGKWRQQLSDSERQALYQGYADGGGVINEDLVRLYERLDKLCVATYLYWRLYVSDWQAADGAREQYRIDYQNILDSLKAST